MTNGRPSTAIVNDVEGEEMHKLQAEKKHLELMLIALVKDKTRFMVHNRKQCDRISMRIAEIDKELKND